MLALRSVYHLHVSEEPAGVIKVNQSDTLLHSTDSSLAMLITLQVDNQPIEDLALSSFLAVMLRQMRSLADPMLVRTLEIEESEELDAVKRTLATIFTGFL